MDNKYSVVQLMYEFGSRFPNHINVYTFNNLNNARVFLEQVKYDMLFEQDDCREISYRDWNKWSHGSNDAVFAVAYGIWRRFGYYVKIGLNYLQLC